MEWLQELFLTRGLPPHGYCLLWQPSLIWTHVVSDAVIAAAYFSIPLVLATLLARRRDIEFGWVVVLFAVFILACGTTHIMSILVLWVPAYGIEALIKIITAVASLVTAVALWPLLPKFAAIPSPRQLQVANAELRREADERAKTEEMLRHSQKMEAIGQLTGGIAHDFNNLLTVVMGNLDRALRHAGGNEAIERSLKNALSATDRAALLTDQLLTFARKQKLNVSTQDINEVVSDVCSMIEHTSGGNISLVSELDARPLPVSVDYNQLQSALLNLAINARDAMPRGGQLEIGTRRRDGQVSIWVADTGAGMDAETLNKATEPFFTTKPLGEGTGLGLSQVYGFVTQAGGTMNIVSEPGKGTIVTLSFPCAEGEKQ
ncbi:hybrid sensor histidine kinase/response regulator [Novosphingobium sp. G106]|uniref:sensor histidine kinase n=1 Tax=Novosphingobium sp. G106 TaxID=2849500 RepID=UPI001C2DE0D1|nr:ATP-binding protein [Novosphingobium sp. G106]MBV1686914.1 hybrid sensor histidine kinase/response regulator [Novosphingobium sp. G106]